MRVLLIEDEAQLPKLSKQELQRQNLTIDVASDGKEGLYLGLAIVTDIVGAYQGTLWLGRIQLGGACFVITLPQR